MTRVDAPAPGASRVRLDRWLWAARFFKTRSEAAAAVAGGQVRVNGERPKRAKLLGAGDEVRIRKSGTEFHVVVRALSEQRGSATLARALYDETPESRAAREAQAFQRKARPVPVFEGKGRPTKRERRALERWRADRDA
ncbi:MAG TPA: S4 domain-containing protein [Gemmatimonadales bacterium]|nr:S4 domain-containing protein [Gemmatimonadales bacterium]